VTEVDAGATLGGPVALQGGTLKGGGTASGNVNNSGGTVDPGASPGTLAIGGGYTQGSGGTLRAEIDGTAPGTGHDVLDVAGAATLDGTLAIVQGGGFDPASSDAFQVLESGSRTGTFATVTGTALSGGRNYTVIYPAGPTRSSPRTPRTASPAASPAPTQAAATPRRARRGPSRPSHRPTRARRRSPARPP
jgi:outer membrane autotransporter protein